MKAGRASVTAELVCMGRAVADAAPPFPEKRARTRELRLAAREVRFLAVDFERDSLDAVLAQAGHEPLVPTTWIWEGVVMYLERAAIESTLRVVERRSALGSHLSLTYAAPTWLLKVVGAVVRYLGEPFRTAFTPAQARALLARHGFTVTADAGLAALGSRISAELGRASKVASHLRVLTAERH